MLRYVVAAACSLAVFASCNPETPKFAFKSAERRGVLNVNGMRFVIMPDPTTELVEVDVHYDVGSREDPQGKAGLAHLVEHLMFQTRPDGPNTAPIFQTLRTSNAPFAAPSMRPSVVACAAPALTGYFSVRR